MQSAEILREPAISLQNLTKEFGRMVAVDHVDLEIKTGELFGLLGANGAGKSTIIKMLTTMLKPSSGSARVWGHDLIEERNAVRSSIGVVFQDPSVDNMLTGRENLDFHGRMYGMDGPLRRDRIDEVLRLVDLTDKANLKVEEYSGGMRRRLEIARGLMHRPHVLFLDEPTLGLDAQTRRYIWQYIRNMNKENGITVVLTTHYMEEADALCDRVAIIDSGKIVALDTPERLKDMIGSDSVSLDVQSGADALISSLQRFPWIKSATLVNGTVVLLVDHAQQRIPEIMLEANKCSAVVTSVGLHKPTLEDVFLKYTGRKIRESGGSGNFAMTLMHRRGG